MSPGGIDRRAVLLGGLAAGLAGPGSAQVPGKNPRPEVPVVVPPEHPRVAGLVGQVSAARLRATVEGLTAFPTRWSPSPQFPAVEDWVARAMGQAGQPVARQGYTLQTGVTRHNIVAGNPLDPRGVVLVGAHFDSISERPGTDAPGANDNASCMAALIEAQRILAPLSFAHEIVFVGFSGEEQGLAGSTACANIAAREGWRVAMMLNLDMLARRRDTPDAPLFIEVDQGNATPANDRAAEAYGALAARLAAEHTSLATAHTDIWDSDYMPFEALGFPCIGFYDGGAEAPEYHSSSDGTDRLDWHRLEQAARLVVATGATVARLV